MTQQSKIEAAHVDTARNSQTGEVTTFCYNGMGAASIDLSPIDGKGAYLCNWCGETVHATF